MIDGNIFRQVEAKHLKMTQLVTASTGILVTDTDWADQLLELYGRVCKDAKIELWMDAVSTVEAFKVLKVIDRLTVLRGNSDEIDTIANALGVGIVSTDPALSCLAIIAKLRVTCAFVISTGASGAFLVTSGSVGPLPSLIPAESFDGLTEVVISKEMIGSCTIVRYMTNPLSREKVIDTTGAGDCLTGGSAWARTNGLPLEHCVPIGMIAARLAVQSATTVNVKLSSDACRVCFEYLSAFGSTSNL